MRFIFLLSLVLVSSGLFAQNIKVEYDKKHDLSRYKTFSFGESQIITPSDQKQVADATLDKWIKNGVKRELEYKGLTAVEKDGDLVVTYAAGATAKVDLSPIGPLGQTPGSNDRVFTHNYQEMDLIIDLNNRSNYLVWRINSTVQMTTTDAERTIDQIVERGFKKFGKAVKKKK
jgi:outer membrane lipoprotein-sorting protein